MKEYLTTKTMAKYFGITERSLNRKIANDSFAERDFAAMERLEKGFKLLTKNL